MVILTIPEETRMPSLEAALQEDGSIAIQKGRYGVPVILTEELSRPEQILARIAMSLAVRMAAKQVKGK